MLVAAVYTSYTSAWPLMPLTEVNKLRSSPISYAPYQISEIKIPLYSCSSNLPPSIDCIAVLICAVLLKPMTRLVISGQDRANRVDNIARSVSISVPMRFTRSRSFNFLNF